MSLKTQWDAARVQRQQEVLERKQSVAEFLEETRSHRQQVSQEAAHDRAAYVATIKNYVWGTTSAPDIVSVAAKTTSLERSKTKGTRKQTVPVRLK